LKKQWLKKGLLGASLVMLSVSAHAEWMGNMLLKDNDVWQDGRLGNYGTVKYFIDEDAADTVPLEVFVEVYAPGVDKSLIEVETYTNLNRREQATLVDDHSGPKSTWYYMPYSMTHVGMKGNNHLYKTTINVDKTGAYRVSTRMKINGGDWQWHNSFTTDSINHRDAAVVVSPKKALDVSLYEVNSAVVEATHGGSEANRSTFEDFTNHDVDGFDPFNVDFVKNTLGFNSMWLMPIFPITEWRFNSCGYGCGDWESNHKPGSPYAAKDFWSVNPLLSDSNTEAAAMSEFQYMVNEAEKVGLNVFIDVAFNHSGRDTKFGQGAVDLGMVPGSQKNSWVKNTRPEWSTKGLNWKVAASSESDAAVYAPVDREGEHSWTDAGFDWYFGDYSSLGPKLGRGGDWDHAADSEKDAFYTDLSADANVRDTFEYFAYILPYWLDKTNGQLDGIRADFAQGLPPQAWEYIINKTRNEKWDFVFLAEVLDPSAILYRVNRQFDIITTVNHFNFRDDNSTTQDYFDVRSLEETSYGYNAAVMHNGTSHDESGNANQWGMLARYAVSNAIYGVPMAYMAQPLGVSEKINFESAWSNMNNSWNNDNNADLNEYYKRINTARDENEAFKSKNSYFLNKKSGGGFNNDILAVARWTEGNIIAAFVNLRNWNVGSETYDFPETINLDPTTVYQAYNVMSDDQTAPLWGAGRTGADILANGLSVVFGNGNEVQYIKIEEPAPLDGKATIHFNIPYLSGIEVIVDGKLYSSISSLVSATNLGEGTFTVTVNYTKDSTHYEGSAIFTLTEIIRNRSVYVQLTTTPVTKERTVVYIYGKTSSGQDMFIRGGLDHDYANNNGRNCSTSNFECAMPIEFVNTKSTTTAPWKVGDTHLDWYGSEATQSNESEGSAMDWTTNDWPSDWGATPYYDVVGYGEDPENSFGMHFWKLDVLMDCSKTENGWFEVKSYITGGPGWEGAIDQGTSHGEPYASGNHFAQCGKKNVFFRDWVEVSGEGWKGPNDVIFDTLN